MVEMIVAARTNGAIAAAKDSAAQVVNEVLKQHEHLSNNAPELDSIAVEARGANPTHGRIEKADAYRSPQFAFAIALIAI